MAKRRRKKTEYGSPREKTIFSGLCQALAGLGMETRLERGKFQGGACRLEDGKTIFFMNKNHSMEHNIALLITELKRQDFKFSLLDETVRAEMSAAATSSN